MTVMLPVVAGETADMSSDWTSIVRWLWPLNSTRCRVISLPVVVLRITSAYVGSTSALVRTSVLPKSWFWTKSGKTMGICIIEEALACGLLGKPLGGKDREGSELLDGLGIDRRGAAAESSM